MVAFRVSFGQTLQGDLHVTVLLNWIYIIVTTRLKLKILKLSRKQRCTLVGASDIGENQCRNLIFKTGSYRIRSFSDRLSTCAT